MKINVHIFPQFDSTCGIVELALRLWRSDYFMTGWGDKCYQTWMNKEWVKRCGIDGYLRAVLSEADLTTWRRHNRDAELSGVTGAPWVVTQPVTDPEEPEVTPDLVTRIWLLPSSPPPPGHRGEQESFIDWWLFQLIEDGWRNSFIECRIENGLSYSKFGSLASSSWWQVFGLCFNKF